METKTAKPSIKELKESVRNASFALVEAYCKELEQDTVPGIDPVARRGSLWGEIQFEVKTGSLDALMSSPLVGQVQVQGAIVSGLNRATLHNYLVQVGLLESNQKAA